MFTEDLPLFVVDFGVQVTLLDRTVTAIFDAPHAVGDVGIGGMATSHPTLTLPTSDVPPQIINWERYFDEPRDPVSVQVTVGGKRYAIVGHEPDGSGMSVLQLEVAA